MDTRGPGRSATGASRHADFTGYKCGITLLHTHFLGCSPQGVTLPPGIEHHPDSHFPGWHPQTWMGVNLENPQLPQ